MKKIYLDNNATTQLAEEVLKIIYKENYPANPSSLHFYGRKAKNALMQARESIASYLKVSPKNLIFTSGGTEAVAIGIRGLIRNPEDHIISTKIEHASVYSTNEYLAKQGHAVTYLNIGKDGAINPEEIQQLITPKTRLIAISAVNSETGVRNDLETIAKIAQNNNIYLFVDAVALLGKDLFTIPDGVTSMAFSSHKIHGPTGVGLCYIKNNIKFTPLFFGGPQEHEKRAGTENLPSILGFAKAIELLNLHLPQAVHNMSRLRNYLEDTLIKEIEGIKINGKNPRICNISNICFKGIDAESLLYLLDQNNILASHGSACSSGAMSPSRVLLNMGIDPKEAKSSIRFSLSRYTTKEEIDITIKTLINLTKKLKE